MILKFFIKKSASSYFYFVTAIFSVTILAASLLFLANDYSNFKSNASYEIKAQNNNIKQKITDSITYTKQIMTHVGKQISTHDHQDYKAINEILINYRGPNEGLLYWNIFFWVDEKHRVKVSSGMGIISEDVDLSDREYILLSQESPETIHIGNPVIGKLSKFYSIPISYGVINKHHEYLGSLASVLVIDNLESQINNIISDDNVLFAIVSGGGDVITKSTKLGSGKNKILLDEMLQIIKNNPEQELTSGIAHYQRLIDCGLECANYGIVTIYDSNAAAHRNMKRLMIYLLIASFGISVAGFMLFGFYENIIHPIAILSETAQKICRNEPTPQIPKFEVHELNKIANSLSEIDKALWKKK